MRNAATRHFPANPAIRRVIRNDDDSLQTNIRYPGGRTTSYTRQRMPKVRKSGITNAIALIETILLVRRMIDDGFYACSRLKAIYDGKGNRLDFLTNVVRSNLRRDNFTGERLLRSHPTLVDQVHTWKQIEIELA